MSVKNQIRKNSIWRVRFQSLSLIFLMLYGSLVPAQNHYFSSTAAKEDIKNYFRNQNLVYELKFAHFKSLGLPSAAIDKALKTFLRLKAVTTFSVKAQGKDVEIGLKNFRYIGIADYTLHSLEKRFYLLDLEQGTFEKHFVSHGRLSGRNWAQFFSNEIGSQKTSLGVFITGPLYRSPAFKSTAMKLYGIEKTNYNAYDRFIVMHQASYATLGYAENLKKKLELSLDPKFTPRLGRSQGCLALDPQEAQQIISKLQGGALILSYVHDGESHIQANPNWQNVLRIDPRFDPGEDTPEEILQREI
jgi:hypothetical protein